ncbi:hypothetical protein IEQ34_021118 [Dendrobium chrysotoxum]|uniref:Uncharacterized protein n=1 Tax=Dendrobium chrysotoxum TaxID=161865 RepID=A0AAV7G2Q4_DENCH|nr:hypothetical protein IEQ34_021118 [Dendrobium chrysotoxum]
MTDGGSFRRTKKVTHRESSSVEQTSITSNNISTPVHPDSSNADDCNNNEQFVSQSSQEIRWQVLPADDGIWLIGVVARDLILAPISFSDWRNKGLEPFKKRMLAEVESIQDRLLLWKINRTRKDGSSSSKEARQKWAHASEMLAEEGPIKTNLSILMLNIGCLGLCAIDHNAIELHAKIQITVESRTKSHCAIQLSDIELILTNWEMNLHSFAVIILARSMVSAPALHLYSDISLLRKQSNEENQALVNGVGDGDMEKKTLSQHAYEMAEEFDLKMWVCVFINFEEKKVIGDILNSNLDEMH